ncbi:MAG: hypothetical protein WCJ39_04380 [bacterium]
MDETQVQTPLLTTLPSDDELFEAFIAAMKEGVHEGIKSTVDKISGFVENAKDEIKNLIHVDATTGLSLDITIEKGDVVLAAFISKQSWLMRGALKILLSTVGASTFTDFIAKMKKDPEDVTITTGTLSKIMTLFFVTHLGKKYLTQETEQTIHDKIAALFA